MPKLWTETIETHRNQVRDAVLETTAALVAKHGVWAVTMSQIATDSGIGRAVAIAFAREGADIAIACLDELKAPRKAAAQRDRSDEGCTPGVCTRVAREEPELFP